MKIKILLWAFIVCSIQRSSIAAETNPPPKRISDANSTINALRMMREGQEIFRYDTFGDEAFWGGQLRLHETVATLAPSNALALGLKVDANLVPGNVLAKIRNQQLDLGDPKNTLALLKANAVVGVKGIFTGNNLTGIGITCALCHSTVNDSIAPGIGQRLDGWPNRDLNVGAIVASAPTVAPYAE